MPKEFVVRLNGATKKRRGTNRNWFLHGGIYVAIKPKEL